MGNAFMAEILAAVADAVGQVGAETLLHSGTVDEIDDGATAFVVIPHEYYWFNPRPATGCLSRTIAFGVEHPGTDTFAVSARAGSVMGARLEISQESVAVLNHAGLTAEPFRLGYSRRWDQWGGTAAQRPVDLAYMGAADAERLEVLARLAPELADLNVELLIPPVEQRLRPRPDFLMGKAKWQFLAGTKLLLNLHRQAKTAFELVRALEAICNGAVVLTEPSTDMAGLEPGVHLVAAPREALVRRAKELLQAPEQIEQMARDAYQFCVEELDMTASAERLVAVAEGLVAQARRSARVDPLQMPDWPQLRAPYVPDLAHWIPVPYPLPAPDATLPAPLRQAVGELTAHRRQRMELNDIRVGTSGTAEVDAVIVTHAGSGPIQATLASLAAQSVAVNVHVAGIGIPPPEPLDLAASYLTCSLETSLGAARNELIERSAAPYVLVLDAGDELLGDALATLLAQLSQSPQTDIVYPMAAYGAATLVNLFHPEPERLERFAYLTRGYLLRRAALARIGPFAEDPALDAYVDHEFWVRAAADTAADADAGRIRHIHRIGTALWPTDLAKMMAADPSEVRSLLAAAAPPRQDSRRPVSAGAFATTSARQLPKVSGLMGAYNYGRYIVEAIESAMQQDYPADLLELVIVDDGSTDNTAELVAECAERYPGRIKYVPQANAGATAATNRARREATGDLIALLDADDVWLPEKTRRQVALMQAQPDLGLVFSRMRLIDADGHTLHRGYGHQEPIPENGFARVLWENVAVQSSLIIEASLFDQIPAQAPYADWWLCLVAAQRRRIEYLRDDLVLYRWHGANITGGASGTKALREAQKGIEFQRWVLRNFALTEFTTRLTPSEMAYVWTGLENQAQKGLSGLQSHFGRLAVVTDQDRADARRDADAAQAALAAGELETGCALLLRARAADPYDSGLRDRLAEAVADAETAAALPDPLDGFDGFAVITDSDYLLADDRRLQRYASELGDVADAALVIDASRMDPLAAEQELGSLVERCGLSEHPMTLIGVVGELHPSQLRRIQLAVRAVYGEAQSVPAGTDPSAVPRFGPDSLSSLRALAQSRTPASP